MGHDHHFLERLDRASRDQVDFALSLYRDHEAVRFVLDHAKLPADADRIALRIDDAAGGPFVLVARDGHFVTCLAAGMSTGRHPILSRTQLDGLLQRHADHRERLGLAKKLTGKEEGLLDLFKRVCDRADLLSREEFLATSAWQAVLGHEFLNTALEMAVRLEHRRVVWHKVEKAKPSAEPSLHNFWKLLWAHGHLMLLASMGDKRIFTENAAGVGRLQITPTFGLAVQGMPEFQWRAAWIAGRLGKPLLPIYKSVGLEACDLVRWDDAVRGIAAMGLRSANARGDAERALRAIGASPPPRGSVPDTLRPALEAYRASRIDQLLQLLDPERYSAKGHLDFGRTTYLDMTRGLAKDSPHRFARAEDVPDDLATAALINLATYIETEGSRDGILYELLPVAVRARPEHFYLPGEVVRCFRHAQSADEILEIIRRTRKHYGKAEPVTRVKVGRNERCPCGSGKKYKVCCG